MLDEDFKLSTSAALARIEQKVDDFLSRVVVLEDRVYMVNSTKLSTSSLLAIMIIVATVVAGVVPVFAHLFR